MDKIRIEPQWNVNYNVYANPVLGSDQNRTIVECKSQSYHDSSMRTPDQNRTIVECKQRFIFKKGVINEIRIEPQWNVNVDKWKNVYYVVSYQNRTIVECKCGSSCCGSFSCCDQNRTIVECKLEHCGLNINFPIHQNRTIVECKYCHIKALIFSHFNQNRTIVECKFNKPMSLILYNILEQNHSGM